MKSTQSSSSSWASWTARATPSAAFTIRQDHLRRFSEWFRPGPEFLACIEHHARPLPFPTSERRPLPAHTYEKQQRARRLYDAPPMDSQTSNSQACSSATRGNIPVKLTFEE
ncbi:hypothetical protein [Ktedonobacter sp. SOSP1-52]|uniref:hypothetical protein n=1 Tax=Ktedonobacter sp. SOSP1-52 TaxID=2778366 RepID=UPI0019162A10|nr:hypothetical protein [Ktedonobacter sp. SOSP1-52]